MSDTDTNTPGKLGRVVTLTTNPTLDAIAEIPAGAFPNEADVLRVDFRYRIGGKGITCARMLENIGGKALAVVLLGDDAMSKAIEYYLFEEELETKILRTDGQGRIALILTEVEDGPQGKRATGTDYRVNGAGFAVTSAVMDRLLTAVSKSLIGASALTLGGSLPQGAPKDFYARCINEGRLLNVQTMLDSSGDALRRGIEAHPLVVKINGQEASALMGVPAPQDQSQALDLAKSIASTYQVEKVVITLGGKGGVAVDGGERWLIQAPKVDAHGSLGAGDSFFAGLAYGLTKGDTFAQSLCWGAACGASTAEQYAGMIGTRKRVEDLYERVKVEKA